MKGGTIEFPSGLYPPLNTSKKFILPIITLVLITTISLYSPNGSLSLLNTVETNINNSSASALNCSTNSTTSVGLKNECNIFKGNWVPYDKEPYYTNETNCVIDDRQNCMKFGRPDSVFMKWRWKPDECELPLFDADQFLEIVRGKTLAFVGDSVGRNHMQSLVCLLAGASYQPVDASSDPDTRFQSWHYTSHNFTILALWSPLLIKTHNPSPNSFSRNSLMNLYLDEPDKAWSTRIQQADIVILSAGQWFYRPFIYHEKGKVVGCNNCNLKNITALNSYYGYRMAFRTALSTLISLQNFTGTTFLRTFSPSHFENGDWNKGGDCVRTRPFIEMKLNWYDLQFYLAQVEEFRAAEKEGKKRGLKFRLLDTTEAMWLRPDGHPSHYGHWPSENKTIADCVHWCMPGPVDTWSEFLLQMLKMERQGPVLERVLQKYT